MAEFIENSSGEQPVVQETAKQPYVKPETDVIEIDGERHILAMSTEDINWRPEEYDID